VKHEEPAAAPAPDAPPIADAASAAGASPPADAPPAAEEAAGEGERRRPNEGARLIALNMALGGSSREETARYLAENFALDDPDALLDEVYAKAGG
jgi:hypothetical protein